jgi:transposase
MQAGARFAAGHSQAEVARHLGVARQNVSRWHAPMASRRANGDHWTLDRVAAVIERLTGVSHYRGHVWKLLRHRQHYRLQRPARRAIERDERAIARWVAKDWP